MLGLGRLKRYLHNAQVHRIHQSHRARHAADYAPIDNILARFRGAGGLKHDYQGYKLFSLCQLLRSERPHRILEFGSGTSTAIFADYVRETGAELWSVDESADWIANSRTLAAIDAGDERFQLIHAEKRVTREADTIATIGYDLDLGKTQFDLVLVDGPSLWVNDLRCKNAINPDIFAVADNYAPAMILVDIRAATVDAMATRLGHRYDVARSDILTGKLGPDYRYFTEFRRRAGH